MNATVSPGCADEDQSPHTPQSARRRSLAVRVWRHARPFVVGVAVACGLVTPLVVAATPAPLEADLFAASAVLGVVVVAVTLLFRLLRPKLGTLTAVAGTCALCGLLLLGLTAATPACPGTTARCSTEEIGYWTLSGVMAALTSFALVAIVPTFRGMRRLLSRLKTRLRRVGAPDDLAAASQQRQAGSTAKRRETRRRQRDARRRNRPRR